MAEGGAPSSEAASPVVASRGRVAEIRRPEAAAAVLINPEKDSYSRSIAERLKNSNENPDEIWRDLDKDKGVGEARLRSSNKKHIGFSSVDNLGNASREGSSATNFEKVDNASQGAENFLVSGLLAMESSEDKKVQEQARVAREKIKNTLIKLNPLFAAQYAELDRKGQDALINEWASMPEMQDCVNQVLLEITNPESDGVPPIPPEVSNRLAKAKEDHLRAKQELDAKERALKNSKTELARFDPGKDLANELDRLTPEEMARLETEKAQKQIDLNNLRRELEKQRTATEGYVKGTETRKTAEEDLNTLQLQVQKAEAELQQAEAAIKRKDELEQQKKALEHQVDQFQNEFDAITPRVDILRDSEDEAQKEYDRAKIAQSDHEAIYVQKMDRVFEEATRRFLQRRMQKISRAQVAEGENVMNKSQQGKYDELNQSMLKTQERWFSGRKDDVRDDKETERLYQILMHEGPKALMASEFKITPESFPDEKFRNEFQDKMVARILMHKVQAGKLDETQIDMITNTTWGESAIKAFLAKSSLTKDVKDQLRADGIDIDKHPSSKKWLFILAALGLLAGGAVALPALGFAALGAAGAAGAPVGGAAIGAGIGAGAPKLKDAAF